MSPAEAYVAGRVACLSGLASDAYIALRLRPAAREAWRRGWGAAFRERGHG